MIYHSNAKKLILSILFLTSFYSLSCDIPLFKAYPELKKQIPHIPLGNLDSTPIYHAKTIGENNNTHLYVKHDGAYGTDKNGKEIFTGNKRRKLEFLLADAQKNGKKRIYAPGAAESNFTRCA